jgi:tetratricopeptide (TPR) repeat protein
MLRRSIHTAILAGALLPCAAWAQFTKGVTVTLFGTLTVTAKEGVQLPGAYEVLLYDTTRNAVLKQTVLNGGNYRFLNVGNGDWEIVVQVEGIDVFRLAVTLMENHNTEIRKNLELEYQGKPGSKPVRPGTISAADLYQRSAENSAQLQRAAAASSRKDYSEAAKVLQGLVESDPKDFEAWTELGNVLFLQGKTGEAENAFQRALAERPAYPLALLNLGKLNYERKNYDAAIATLTRLVGDHPESAEGHRFLGEAYLRIKRGSRAVPELEEAARLDPAGQAEAHLSLAALYDAAGVKDRAAAEYEKFLAKKPGYPERKKLEQYIRDNKKEGNATA